MKKYILKNTPHNLKNNSSFSKSKSEIFMDYQSNYNEIEDSWNDTKTDISRTYKINIRNIKDTINKKKLLNKKANVESLNLSIDILKSDYTKEIQELFKQIELRKEKLLRKAKKDFQDLVFYFETGKKRYEPGSIEYIKETLKEDQNKLDSFRKRLSSKVKQYNERLNLFNQAKTEHAKKIKRDFYKIKQMEDKVKTEQDQMLLKLKVEQRRIKREKIKNEEEILNIREQMELETEQQLNDMEKDKRRIEMLLKKMENFVNIKTEEDKKRVSSFKRTKKVIDRDIENLKKWNTGELLQAKIFFNLYEVPELDFVKKIYKANLKRFHPDTNDALSHLEHDMYKKKLEQNIYFYKIIKLELTGK